VGLIFTGEYFDMKTLTHFWKLPIASLIFKRHFSNFDDSDIRKITSSFPRLQYLNLDQSRITDQGIALMCSLKELRVVKIGVIGDISQGIQQLADCDHLRELRVNGARLRTNDLKFLVRFCRNLRSLAVYDIEQVDTPEMAKEILRQVAGVGKRNVVVTIRNYYSIWKWEALEPALKEMKMVHGVGLSFVHDVHSRRDLPWVSDADDVDAGSESDDDDGIEF